MENFNTWKVGAILSSNDTLQFRKRSLKLYKHPVSRNENTSTTTITTKSLPKNKKTHKIIIIIPYPSILNNPSFSNPPHMKPTTAVTFRHPWLLRVGAHASIAHHADGHARRQGAHANCQACLGVPRGCWMDDVWGAVWPRPRPPSRTWGFKKKAPVVLEDAFSRDFYFINNF